MRVSAVSAVSTAYDLLLIDDDREAGEIASRSFAARGYRVRYFSSAARGVASLREQPADCVVLDVMMPGMDGFEACRKIRDFSAVPVLFLTGRVSEDDKVTGFAIGADDYIEKPYSFRELEARVSASIRRVRAATPGRISLPPLELDLLAHKLFNGEALIELTTQEFALFLLLAQHAGNTVTYERIGMHLWGHYRPEDRRTIMMRVSRLRKKLIDHAVPERLLETVWGKGYIMKGRAG